MRLMTLNSCLAFPSANILLVELNNEYGWQGNPAQYKLTSGRPPDTQRIVKTFENQGNPCATHTHHVPPSNIVNWNSFRFLREDVGANLRPHTSSCRKQQVKRPNIKKQFIQVSPLLGQHWVARIVSFEDGLLMPTWATPINKMSTIREWKQTKWEKNKIRPRLKLQSIVFPSGVKQHIETMIWGIRPTASKNNNQENSKETSPISQHQRIGNEMKYTPWTSMNKLQSLA